MCIKILVNSVEVPPPSKRMKTMKDEGVKQLQPKALDSEEIGEASQMQLYLNYIPTSTCVAKHLQIRIGYTVQHAQYNFYFLPSRLLRPGFKTSPVCGTVRTVVVAPGCMSARSAAHAVATCRCYSSNFRASFCHL